jgi:hypothetical protein
VLIPLSPCLIFGLGPLPRLGVAGGAVAVLIYYGAGSLVLAAYLRSPRSIVRLTLKGIHLRWPLFRDILGVGLVAALITLQTNLTIAIATALVGVFGAAAIAGYGVGSRLEYLLIPLVFGLGGPLVAMVGTNIGAGRRDRVLRIAWVGAAKRLGLLPRRFRAPGSCYSAPSPACSTPARAISMQWDRSSGSSGSAWRFISRRRGLGACCGRSSLISRVFSLRRPVDGWRCASTAI